MNSNYGMTLCVFCVLLSAAFCASDNDTTNNSNVVGVYPISGQYGTLNRLLLYVLWVVVITLCKGCSWIAIGALAYIMTYSAATAVHALVLAITSAHGLYDLDIPATWAILSISTVMAILLAFYSSSIRHGEYRLMFGLWTTIVASGAVCSVVALSRTFPEDVACHSRVDANNATTLLTTATQLLVPGAFNCTYGCFDTSQVNREPGDITIVFAERAFGDGYSILQFSIGFTVFSAVYMGVLGSCFNGGKRRTKAELIKAANRTNRNNLTSEQQYRAEQARRRARKELEAGEYRQARRPWALLNLLPFVGIVLINEMYILTQPSLPSSESAFMVGQWAPWVTIGLSLMGAAFNEAYERLWGLRQSTIQADIRELGLSKMNKSRLRLRLDLEKALDQPVQPGAPVLDGDNLKKLSLLKPARVRTTNQPVSMIDSTSSDTRPNSPRSSLSLRQRNRLPIPYCPPFEAHRLTDMSINQHDKACEAYQDWNADENNTIVRDVYGHDWLVSKGILWHRELWEKPESE